ncbi:MAG: hypothetical protein K0S15_240 [Solirubrobacterales bacterium]|nr:hypothetical protein [Solirubrobacterales bacterium]
MWGRYRDLVSEPAPGPPSASPLRRPVPGRIFGVVKAASWIELGLFSALLFFWLAPGFEHETFIFGMAHGLGYIALCLLIVYALLRREAPWPLFAATLTPAGPVGSVIGIELIERRGWGVAAAPEGAEEAQEPPGEPSPVTGIDTTLRKSG